LSLQRIRTKYGQVFARDNDPYVGASLCYYGEYSHAEVKLMSLVLRPGDIAVDVGANIGALTVPMASIVGPKGMVFAFEPQRVPFQMLCGSLMLNDLRNVYAINAPVGSNGEQHVRIPEVDPDHFGNCGALSLVEPHADGIPLRMVALDQYKLHACRLIKADVEGMEPDVLDGAMETLRKHHPVLILEADREPRAYSLAATLKPLGYRCYMHFAKLYRAENFKGHTPNIWKANNSSLNLVALPEWWDAPVPKYLRDIDGVLPENLFLEHLPGVND
jgi:FkbM family methyltransferase